MGFVKKNIKTLSLKKIGYFFSIIVFINNHYK